MTYKILKFCFPKLTMTRKESLVCISKMQKEMNRLKKEIYRVRQTNSSLRSSLRKVSLELVEMSSEVDEELYK